VLTGVKIGRVGRSGAEYRVQVEANGQQQTLVAEQLLITTGRRADTSGFSLEEVGVTLGRKGEILVDQHLRTRKEQTHSKRAPDRAVDPLY
jgi:mercuric reductase